VASDTNWCRPVLLHTGQHYHAVLSNEIWRDLGLPDPDEDLGIGPGKRDWQLAEIQRRLEISLLRLNPTGVVVFGDVNSTLAAARAAAKLQLPLAHVEAGLRSFDPRMVEEENRIAVDALSDILFTTEPSATENLRNEGANMNHVHAAGNLMVDCLKHHLPAARSRQASLHDRYGLQNSNYAVLTLHRPENINDIDALRRFMDKIGQISSKLPIVFPTHPRTAQQLTNAWRKKHPAGLIVTEPLPYVDFLALLESSRVVLTDSGGIQEESSVLGIPCLTLRNNTERPITLTHGTNQLIGFDGDKAKGAIEQLLLSYNPTHPAPHVPVPDSWDGRAACRIMEVLKNAWG